MAAKSLVLATVATLTLGASAQASLVDFYYLEAYTEGHTYASTSHNSASAYPSGNQYTYDVNAAVVGLDANASGGATAKYNSAQRPHNLIEGPNTASYTGDTYAYVNNTSAASGAFLFASSTSAHVASNSPSGYAQSETADSYAYYEFTLSAKGKMDLSWLTQDSNYNADGYYVYLYNTTDGSTYSTFWTPSQDSGSTSISMTPGFYEFYVQEYYYGNDVTSQSGPGTSAGGYLSSEFNWSISSAVPEFSTWAMMGMGFVGLGLAGSRRVRGAQTAAV